MMKDTNNTLQMIPVTRSLKAKESQWVGEFQDAEGNNLGFLYKTSAETWHVYRLREFGFGEVEAESRPLAKAEIERAGSTTISGGARVRFYRLKVSTLTTTRGK